MHVSTQKMAAVCFELNHLEGSLVQKHTTAIFCTLTNISLLIQLHWMQHSACQLTCGAGSFNWISGALWDEKVLCINAPLVKTNRVKLQ